MIRLALTICLLSATLASAQTYESVTANAVLHWQMQDNAATNFVASLAGPAGALSNGTTAQVHTTGPVGPLPGAFDLQGTGWHPQISVANMIEGTNELTVGIWVKLPAYPSGYEPILAIGADEANVELQAGPDGRLRVNFTSAGTSSNTSTTGQLTLGTWHHVVATFDMYQVNQEGDAEVLIKAYVDNTEVISATEASYPTLTHTGNGKITIGAARSGGARGNGHYCDSTIFLDVLDQQERAALATGSGAPLSTPPSARGDSGWNESQTIGDLTEVTSIAAQSWENFAQTAHGIYTADSVGSESGGGFGSISVESDGWLVSTTNAGATRFAYEYEGTLRYYEATSDGLGQLFLPPDDELEAWEPFATALLQPPPTQPAARPASGLVNNTLVNVVETEVGEGVWGYTHDDLPNGWRVHFTAGRTITADVDGWYRIDNGDGNNLRLSFVVDGVREYYEVFDDTDGQAHAVYLPPAGETPYWSPWLELMTDVPGPPPSRPASGILDNTIANMLEVRQSVADSWGTLQTDLGDAGHHNGNREQTIDYDHGWSATKLPAGYQTHRVSVTYQGVTRYFTLEDPTSETNSTLWFPPAADLDQFEPWATLLADEPPSPCEPSTSDCDGDCIPNFSDATKGCGTGNVDDNGDPVGNGDSDGDGIPDNRDVDPDGDGLIDCRDADGDGTWNRYDRDDDDDGIIDWLDSDPDGDGLTSEQDDDDDGDCIPDLQDPDMDGDGILNVDDADLDGDLIPNDFDSDIDGDGISNELDPDDDGDGVLDGYSPPALARVNGQVTNQAAMGPTFYGTSAKAFAGVVAGDSQIALAVAPDPNDAPWHTPRESQGGCECPDSCITDEMIDNGNAYCVDSVVHGDCIWSVGTGRTGVGGSTARRHYRCGEDCNPDDCDNDGLYDEYDDDTCDCGDDPDNDPEDPPPDPDTPCADDPCSLGCPASTDPDGPCDPDLDPEDPGEEQECEYDHDGDGICDGCDVDCWVGECDGITAYQSFYDAIGECDDNDGDGSCDHCGDFCFTSLIKRFWQVFEFANVYPRCELIETEMGGFYIFGQQVPSYTISIYTCFHNIPVLDTFRHFARELFAWIVGLIAWYLYFSLLWRL